MHKYNLISILVPICSVIILISALIFLKPDITGLAIYSQNGTQKLNADVILKTKSGEVIPPNAIIQVWIDNTKAEMTISDFIKKAGEKYEIKYGELPEFGFYGNGFTGNFTYNLTLADFNMNREMENGEHKFITRIIYRNKILYEKENRIMITKTG